MRYFFLLLVLFFVSCGYPDIDTVPSFEKLKLTKQESIDLCNLSSNDKKEVEKCIESIDSK
tara:strand:+ start:158 stop:340 length:183 start_codon:yes stop_codon:yes gene_type:complete